MTCFKQNKKKILISILILVIILFIVILMVYNHKKKIKQLAEKIEFTISNDYEYFDVSVDDFYTKISYELRNNNIKTEVLKSINYDEVYDLYYSSYCEWNYSIDLSNKDKILLCSNDKGKTISAIGYDFSKNMDGKDAGYFIASISALFDSSSFDSDDFMNNVGNDFLAKEETYDFSSSTNARYVYNHILYGIDTMEGVNADGSINETKQYIFAIFAPVKEVTNDEWKENSEREWEEWKENYEKEQAEKKAKEEEEKKRKAKELEKQKKEEADKLKSKERIFTAGTYEVGIDIPTGKYNMIAISGRDACIVKNKVYEIFSPNPDEYSIDKYNNVKLEWGDEIQVDGKLKIKFEPIE